jgi:hypothetical protein
MTRQCLTKTCVSENQNLPVLRGWGGIVLVPGFTAAALQAAAEFHDLAELEGQQKPGAKAQSQAAAKRAAAGEGDPALQVSSGWTGPDNLLTRTLNATAREMGWRKIADGG